MGQLDRRVSSSAGREPVVPAICEAIKSQIRSGAFGPGAYLPSTRALAAEWGVSRTTITAAYEQLLAEGYIETRQGARAQVVRSLGPDTLKPTQDNQIPPAALRLSDFGRRVSDFPVPPQSDPSRFIADFRYGDLAAVDFPTLAWKKAINAALLHRPSRLRYGDPRGSLALRQALQGYLWPNLDSESPVVIYPDFYSLPFQCLDRPHLSDVLRCSAKLRANKTLRT